MCFNPQTTKDQSKIYPCGKCPECKARRTSSWSFRLLQQQKFSDSSLFVTLTYDTDNVPITPRGFMGLKKRDLQLFFKRLRKISKNDSPIKYYAVGEYGTRTMRPHYHIILFNCDAQLIPKAWTLGNIHIGDVSGASVGYTLKYISKPSKVPLHSNDDRDKEFSIMSKDLAASISENSFVSMLALISVIALKSERKQFSYRRAKLRTGISPTLKIECT